MERDYSGREVDDDAREEAESFCAGLTDAGHIAPLVQWRGDDLAGMLSELKSQSVDLVFNASSVQEVRFLNTSGLPYCGSGPDLVGSNKAARKKILLHRGLRTSPFVVVEKGRRARGLTVTRLRQGWEPQEPLRYPLFVKPVEGRGSAGVSDDSIVTDLASLIRQAEMITVRLRQGALVENYLEGREVTVGIVGDPPLALPPLEIEYNGTRTNTYEHKMDNEIVHCPARLSAEVASRVRCTAKEACDVIGVKDYARVDTIVDSDGIPTVLEINTFAGLHISTGSERSAHASYIGAMAKAAGLSQGDLLGTIVDSAMKRYGIGLHGGIF